MADNNANEVLYKASCHDKIVSTACYYQRHILYVSSCRRSFQLTQCGFHGPPICPYKDVGEVVLDDRRLIQESIGQRDSAEKEDQLKVN